MEIDHRKLIYIFRHTNFSTNRFTLIKEDKSSSIASILASDLKLKIKIHQASALEI